MRGTNAQAVVSKLNPIIRGWANYYRTQVSSETFDELDQHLWPLTWKWARYSHQNKPKSWVFAGTRANSAHHPEHEFGTSNSPPTTEGRGPAASIRATLENK